MRKLLNLGAGPIHLDNIYDLECENSDFAQTESSQGWSLEKLRDFTKPLDDIESNTIDYIVAWHIWEHIPMHEADQVGKEWLRVLRPGGMLFIATPDLTKIARHIVDRDGPWSDWFICMVNVFGPYNGFVGDLHRWGNDFTTLGQKLNSLGYVNYQELDPNFLASHIGANNANKLGFAEYNIQAVAIK